MMPKYPGLDINSALVVVDWSGWIHRAWHVGGIEKTASIVVGWFVALLSDPMPCSMVVAVDPPTKPDGFSAWTFRHRATAELEEKKRYKGNRPPKPPEMVAIERRLREVVEAHSVPVLGPEDPTVEQDWEADDSAATAVRLATDEGRPVLLVTGDKDWLQLVQSEDPMKPLVLRWDPSKNVIEDEKSVLEKFGVSPAQLTDLLAIMGDTGDNVPGVRGLGPKKAARLIWEFGGLDEAIAAAEDAETSKQNKLLAVLHEQRQAATFSRSLVKLWDRAPIDWDPPSQAVGDFDARRIRRLYQDFGFTRLAESIPTFPKYRAA